MSTFPEKFTRIRRERNMSQSAVANRSGWSRAYISHWETGRLHPDPRQTRDLDHALSARGELIAAAQLDSIDAADVAPEETSELLARLRSADVSRPTLERLEAAAFELCCRYPYMPADELRSMAQEVIRDAAGLLNRPVGLREHRELLVSTGWLALLIGCCEYDMGMRRAANSTRRMAEGIAREAGHSEMVGWSAEMSAWFALTQGHFADVLNATRKGLQVAAGHNVAVQLYAQEAKALARVGDLQQVERALSDGRAVLDRMQTPDRPEHHFVVDPSKWDFYAMDTYRLAGDDVKATAHAREVLTAGTAPDGSERSPMRMAEARLTLAVAAARSGDLDEAYEYGLASLSGARRSLPTLVLVGAELDSELSTRFPNAPLTRDFRERLSALRT